MVGDNRAGIAGIWHVLQIRAAGVTGGLWGLLASGLEGFGFRIFACC